jgi:hypothetical protein
MRRGVVDVAQIARSSFLSFGVSGAFTLPYMCLSDTDPLNQRSSVLLSFLSTGQHCPRGYGDARFRFRAFSWGQ